MPGARALHDDPMANVVYATYPDRATADDTTAILLTRSQGMGPFSLQTHAERLDPLTLPDAATVLRRNTYLYITGGLLLGLVSGFTAAIALPELPGLGGFTFPVAGTIAGAIVGFLCASMAGSREPKAAIEEAATALREGKVLVTVLVESSAERERVREVLSERCDAVRWC